LHSELTPQVSVSDASELPLHLASASQVNAHASLPHWVSQLLPAGQMQASNASHAQFIPEQVTGVGSGD
jgi:hypothetical protein